VTAIMVIYRAKPDSCCVATNDPIEKYARHAIQVERILRKFGVTGSAGGVLLMLKMADTQLWVRQKEVQDAIGAAKDLICKLVRHLVDDKFLKQEQDTTNKKMNLLQTTDLGRQILADVNAALRSDRSRVAKTKTEPYDVAVKPSEVAIAVEEVAIDPDEIVVGYDEVVVGPDKVVVRDDEIAASADEVTVGSDEIVVNPNI